MKPNKNVIFVDFRSRRKPMFSGFRRGSGLTAGVFLGLLAAEILGAAAFLPSAIGSAFFAPTTIAVAVAGTMGVNRVATRIQTARLLRRASGRGSPTNHDPERTGRTLH
jgi:hypothetical protein